MSFASIGSAAFRARYSPAPAPAASVGFTNPLAIDDEAKAVNFSAQTLLGDYQRDLPASDPTRQAYEKWFGEVWSPFYAKLFSFVQGLPPVFLTGTDARMAALQARRSELSDFAAKYTTATQKPPSAPVPVDPRTQPPPPKPPGGGMGLPAWWPGFLTPPKVEVPWWVWVGGTLAVLAGGYGLYRSWKKQREIQQAAINVLPGLFAGSPHAYGEVAATAARDPVTTSTSTSCGCATCGGH